MPDIEDKEFGADVVRRHRCRGSDAVVRTPRRERFNLRQFLEMMVASGFDIDEETLRQPTRGEARIALARQVAMYLAHVACGLNKADAGRLFERDRTTVHHACMVVEERRDDAGFDRAVEHLEQVVKVIVGSRSAA